MTPEEAREFLAVMGSLEYRWENDEEPNTMRIVADVPAWAARRWPEEIQDYIDRLGRAAETQLERAAEHIESMDFNEVTVSPGVKMRMGVPRDPVFYDERRFVQALMEVNHPSMPVVSGSGTVCDG